MYYLGKLLTYNLMFKKIARDSVRRRIHYGYSVQCVWCVQFVQHVWYVPFVRCVYNVYRHAMYKCTRVHTAVSILKTTSTEFAQRSLVPSDHDFKLSTMSTQLHYVVAIVQNLANAWILFRILILSLLSSLWWHNKCPSKWLPSISVYTQY